jgi:molybdopterin converting factor small subunit
MKRKIYMYGRLKDAGHGDHISLVLPPEATAKQVLAAVKSVLGRRSALLSGCVLATNDTVLRSTDVVPQTGALAVLPPVCGG